MARPKLLLMIPPALLAVFVGFVAAGNFRENRDDLPAARSGQTAPAVELDAMAGRTPFTDDLIRSGEVTLVNFWASWCPPCRAEHPVLERLAAEGVPIMGVNYRDQRDRAEDFLAELGDPFRAVGADPRARMGLDWGVVGLPETFVIDRGGRVVLRYAGPITDEIVERRIRPAMMQAAGQ